MSREPRISRNGALQRDVITIQFFLRQQQNQEPLTKKINIWKINEKTNSKTYETVIKEELKHITLNQHCPTEAHKLLKNTILKTAKTTIRKYQMANNILDHPQSRKKRKQIKHYKY